MQRGRRDLNRPKINWWHKFKRSQSWLTKLSTLKTGTKPSGLKVSSRVRKHQLGNLFKRIFLAIAIVILIAALYFSYTKLVVNEYSCETQFGPCPEEITQWLNTREGEPLINAFLTLQEELLTNFPYIVTNSLSLAKFDSVRVTLSIKKPVVAITTPRLVAQNEYFLVNPDGYLIDKTAAPELPIVSLYQLNTAMQEQLPNSQINAIRIAQQLPFLGYLFEAQQTEDQTLTVKLHTDETILFPLNSDNPISELVSALQLILSQAKIEPSKHRVDLRFKQPVIRDITAPIPTPLEASESALLEENEVN